MEDRIIENNKSAKSSGRQEYADSLFHALVACYVNDLKHGLENFTSINHVKNLGACREVRGSDPQARLCIQGPLRLAG